MAKLKYCIYVRFHTGDKAPWFEGPIPPPQYHLFEYKSKKKFLEQMNYLAENNELNRKNMNGKNLWEIIAVWTE